MPIVITSALGSGSVKKSPAAAVTRSLRPAASIARFAIGSTTGRSKLVQRMCGWRSATMIESWPVAPPTSHSVWYLEKSNFSASAWKWPVEMPGHRVHELLEPGRVGVELVEHRLAGVLDLVLRLAGPQRLGEVAPEPDTAARWPSRGCRRCRPGSPCRGTPRSPRCCGSAPLARLRRDRAARARPARRGSRGPRAVVEPELARRSRHRSSRRRRAGEQLELDGRQERLRRPEPHPHLHDLRRIDVPVHAGGRYSNSAHERSPGNRRGCRVTGSARLPRPPGHGRGSAPLLARSRSELLRRRCERARAAAELEGGRAALAREPRSSTPSTCHHSARTRSRSTSTTT